MHSHRSTIRFIIKDIRYSDYSGKVAIKLQFLFRIMLCHISPLLETTAHRRHFGDERIISQQSPTTRSPDMNRCDFWLWRYLKTMVYRDPISSLSDLKESIERHVRNIPQIMLLSTVEHVIFCFQKEAEIGNITSSMF